MLESGDYDGSPWEVDTSAAVMQVFVDSDDRRVPVEPAFSVWNFYIHNSSR